MPRSALKGREDGSSRPNRLGPSGHGKVVGASLCNCVDDWSAERLRDTAIDHVMNMPDWLVITESNTFSVNRINESGVARTQSTDKWYQGRLNLSWIESRQSANNESPIGASLNIAASECLRLCTERKPNQMKPACRKSVITESNVTVGQSSAKLTSVGDDVGSGAQIINQHEIRSSSCNVGVDHIHNIIACFSLGEPVMVENRVSCGTEWGMAYNCVKIFNGVELELVGVCAVDEIKFSIARTPLDF